MTENPIRLFIFIGAACLLAACVPKPELEASRHSPDVTGPFDLYFPQAEQQFQVTTAHHEETVARIKKIEAEKVPLKGELKVGLLIPKTGDSAQLGQDFMDAAMLALYDAQLSGAGGYQITLIPKDTAGSPSVALEAAKDLLAQDVKIIVGPLYSQSSETISATLKPPLMISLSNNNDIASENNFIFGFTPEEEMERTLVHALKRNNSRVVALLPNNAYGHKLEKVIRTVVPGHGASLEAVERYVTTEDGRRAAAKRLANHVRQLRIHTICFGDTKENTTQMLSMLQEYGMDMKPVVKIGTSLWHGDGVATPPALVGGYYSASDQRNYNRFRKRFSSAYARDPERLATLMYDAITLLVEVASQGNIPSRTDLMAAEAVQGSASGTYQFEPDGKVLRGLAIYQLTSDKHKVIENAPKHF